MRRRFDQPALRNHCRPLRGESAEQVYIFANKTKDRARGPRDASPNCAFRQINFLLLLRHRWFHRARPFQVCRGLRPPNRWLKVIENDDDRLIDWNLPCAFYSLHEFRTSRRSKKLKSAYLHVISTPTRSSLFTGTKKPRDDLSSCFADLADLSGDDRDDRTRFSYL